MRRKLAAILFADIVDYTRRMSSDEASGLAMRRLLDDAVRGSAAATAGRVVKPLGDGWMLEFESAVAAVSCALELQQKVADLNRGHPGPVPVQLRIGIHVGDVVEEDGDLHGNTV